MKLDISKVKNAGTQVRAGINQQTVNRYAERMVDGETFPPVIVFFDGTEYHLADGFHRVESALACGFTTIDADVRAGSRQDAVWYALGANGRHGLPMTREDTRNAIALALREFCDRSNREIARQIGCTDKTVAVVRAELEATAAIPQLEKTLGADGRMRTAKRTPDAWAQLSFIPKAGRVANSVIGMDQTVDGHVHVFMVQEDHRNAGYFFAVHFRMEPGENGGGFYDFTKRPIQAGWGVRKTLESMLPAGFKLDDLRWTETDDPKTYLWDSYIEPARVDYLTHLKQRKPAVEVAT